MTYSPVLAMVTAAFEIAAAVWVLRGPGRRAILRTTAAILVFLAGYQIVEVAICSAAPGYGFLPRLAFMVVSWLPPLGILLVALLLGPARPSGAWVRLLHARFRLGDRGLDRRRHELRLALGLQRGLRPLRQSDAAVPCLLGLLLAGPPRASSSFLPTGRRGRAIRTTASSQSRSSRGRSASSSRR